MCGFEYAAACLMLQEGMERQALEIVSAHTRPLRWAKAQPVGGN